MDGSGRWNCQRTTEGYYLVGAKASSSYAFRGRQEWAPASVRWRDSIARTIALSLSVGFRRSRFYDIDVADDLTRLAEEYVWRQQGRAHGGVA